MTNMTFYKPIAITNRKIARTICGSLSEPSKMPCHGYSIPADTCVTGSKLRLVEGSTCAKCYALKGHYPFPSVQAAMYFRLGNLYHPQWVAAITFLIRATGEKWFRWHDSGDLQSLAHLINIVGVAEALPRVKFWLPTREKSICGSYVRSIGAFPPNLTVRMSAAMVAGLPPDAAHTSTVHRRGDRAVGHECPAPRQGNKCDQCRACWSPRVKNVSYLEH